VSAVEGSGIDPAGRRVAGQALACGWCGEPVRLKARGRPPKWCSPRCRRRAWEQARAAANAFLDNMPSQNRVGLVTFDSQPQVYDFNLNSMIYVDPNSLASSQALSSFEGGQGKIRNQIENLQASGDTSLYDAILQAIELLKAGRGDADDRIQAIVVLSDGQDTSSLTALQTVVEQIKTNKEDRNPVIVIPVAYGGDADINALNGIARASATRVQSGDPENIQKVLEIISSYF
jgi:Ca-activated chloride channel family protein